MSRFNRKQFVKELGEIIEHKRQVEGELEHAENPQLVALREKVRAQRGVYETLQEYFQGNELWYNVELRRVRDEMKVL